MAASIVNAARRGNRSAMDVHDVDSDAEEDDGRMTPQRSASSPIDGSFDMAGLFGVDGVSSRSLSRLSDSASSPHPRFRRQRHSPTRRQSQYELVVSKMSREQAETALMQGAFGLPFSAGRSSPAQVRAASDISGTSIGVTSAHHQPSSQDPARVSQSQPVTGRPNRFSPPPPPPRQRPAMLPPLLEESPSKEHTGPSPSPQQSPEAMLSASNAHLPSLAIPRPSSIALQSKASGSASTQMISRSASAKSKASDHALSPSSPPRLEPHADAAGSAGGSDTAMGGLGDRKESHQALRSITATAAMVASTSPYLLSPDAAFFRLWDPLIMIMLLITATLTPYEVAFLEGFTVDYDGLWWCNRVIDVSFIVDMCLQFFVVRWISTQRRYTQSLSETSAMYLQGWFVIDFISVFPWEILGGLLNDDSVSSLALLRIFRLFRLLKLVRLVRASRILKRWEASMELRYSVMHLCYFLLLCVAVSHWLACLWRLSVDDLGRMDTWIGESRLTVDVDSPLSVYITSLYFSVYCVTTAGFGDITPQNDTERLVAILTMAAGASIYAYSVGSVSAIVASMDEASNAFHQTMDNLNEWMDEVCIPADMRSELRQYFHHTRSLARENTYRRLLSHMSPTLRMRVASHCHAAWVREVAFLASSRVPKIERDTFVMELSLRLIPVSFAPDEAIIRHNEPASTLYIVKRGLIIRSLPQFKLQAGCDFRVGSPKVIGEDFIMTRYFRPYSVRTLTFLDGYSLDKRVVEQLLRHDEFPNTKAVLRRHAISSALKAKLPALALTFALMSRVRYGSVGSNEDVDWEASPSESYSDAEVEEQEEQVGVGQSTVAEAVGEAAADAGAGLAVLPHARIGFITSEQHKSAIPSKSATPSTSHPGNVSVRGARSSGKPSPSRNPGGTFFPPATTPSIVSRRGSSLSVSSAGMQPSSLNEHAIAKQVTSHWEGAKVLLTAMERDASAPSQPPSPARPSSFSMNSSSTQQGFQTHIMTESTGLQQHSAGGRLRRTASDSSAFRSKSHSEEDGGGDTEEDLTAAADVTLASPVITRDDMIDHNEAASGLAYIPEQSTAYSSARSGVSTPDLTDNAVE